jgi:hypothetical protein
VTLQRKDEYVNDETIALYFYSHAEHRTVVCRQNTEYHNVKAGGV